MSKYNKSNPDPRQQTVEDRVSDFWMFVWLALSWMFVWLALSINLLVLILVFAIVETTFHAVSSDVLNFLTVPLFIFVFLPLDVTIYFRLYRAWCDRDKAKKAEQEIASKPDPWWVHFDKRH